MWSFRAGRTVDLWHARYKQSSEAVNGYVLLYGVELKTEPGWSTWRSLSLSLFLSFLHFLSLSAPLPLSLSPPGWLARVPCETVIGCTPCSCANPGAVGKYFLSWRIDFLRQHVADATDHEPTRKFIRPPPVIDAPLGPLINLSTPIATPRRLINSDRRSFRRSWLFFLRYFAGADARRFSASKYC